MSNSSNTPAPRSWRAGAVQARKAQSRASRRGLFIGLGTIIAVLTGLVLLLLRLIVPNPATEFVSIWTTDYTDRALPADPTAPRDEQAFRQALGGQSQNLTTLSGPDDLATLQARLKPVKTDQPVVVCVSALARTGRVEGDAPRTDAERILLLPAGATVDHLTGTPLRSLLEALKACPSRQKLLILDLMRPLASPERGVLRDDVADALPRELEAVPDRGRLVLSACAPGQVAQASEALGRSVFNHFVAEGLNGRADTREPFGRISARELGDYVCERVEMWTRHNLGASQTPVLSGPDKLDFTLVVLSKAQRTARNAPAKAVVSKETVKKDAAKAAPEKSAPSYPDWLADGWKVHARWRSGGSAVSFHRIAPRPFQRLEAALLRRARLALRRRSRDRAPAAPRAHRADDHAIRGSPIRGQLAGHRLAPAAVGVFAGPGTRGGKNPGPRAGRLRSNLARTAGSADHGNDPGAGGQSAGDREVPGRCQREIELRPGLGAGRRPLGRRSR